MRCPWAAGINVVAIVLGIIFLSSSLRGPYFSTIKKAARVLNFAWSPKSHKYQDCNQKKKIGDPPLPPHYDIFGRTGGILKKCPRVPKLRI